MELLLFFWIWTVSGQGKVQSLHSFLKKKREKSSFSVIDAGCVTANYMHYVQPILNLIYLQAHKLGLQIKNIQ